MTSKYSLLRDFNKLFRVMQLKLGSFLPSCFNLQTMRTSVLDGFNFSLRRDLRVAITILTILVTSSCPLESHGRARISVRLAKIICASAVDPSKLDQSLKAPFIPEPDCKTVHWSYCEPTTCTKFDLKDKCSEGSSKNVETEPADGIPPPAKPDSDIPVGGGGIKLRRLTNKKPKFEPASGEAPAQTTTEAPEEPSDGNESPMRISTRILGGKNAKSGEFPYQIAFNEVGKIKCGGSILNENWVLTAAHCMVAPLANDWDVTAGEYDSSEDDGTEQWRKIEKMVVHEKYDVEKSLHDIALVKLDTPLELGKYVKPVVLPKKGSELKKGKATVTGWGALKSEGDQPEILQKVEVNLIYYKDCAKSYKSAAEFTITENMICAGYLGKGGKDSCQGDSGGPLTMKNKKGSFLQVGVVSFGKGCGEAKFPGVYVQVSKYIDWINKHIKKK